MISALSHKPVMEEAELPHGSGRPTNGLTWPGRVGEVREGKGDQGEGEGGGKSTEMPIIRPH